jgi:quinoprotein glucose dehydrogenase
MRGATANFGVYDAETGAVLCTTARPAGSRGIPSMYEVNGRQFFVVNATSPVVAAPGRETPASPASPLARSYVAFALPERPPLQD